MPSLAAPPPSATLATNERVQAKLAAGEDVLHLAFGEAGLPVLPEVAERLAEGAGRTATARSPGSPAAREAAAGYFERRGLPTDPGRIVFAPGSKPLLFALLQALPGDVVLPRPCWVSYAAHAALAGKRVIHVPIAAAGRRRARPGGAARGARGGERHGAPARRARAHAARQPDRNGRFRGRSSARSARSPTRPAS